MELVPLSNIPEPQGAASKALTLLEDIPLPASAAGRALPAPPAMKPMHTERIATLRDLDRALEAYTSQPLRKLGEVLVESGLVRAQDIEEALHEQKSRPGRPLGEILVARGKLGPDQIRSVLAGKLGIPTVDARQFPATDEARRLIPAETCLRHKLLPLHVSDGALIVAMDNPMSPEALHAARFASGCRIVPVLANGEDIRAALRTKGIALAAPGLWRDAEVDSRAEPPPPPRAQPTFGGDGIEFDLSGVEALTTRLTQELVRHTDEEEPGDSVRDSDSTLVQLVNKIILDAHDTGASDIHIEPAPGKGGTRVRMRRDGVLFDYAELPARFRGAVISRIKVMASLNIAERRKPQDGKIDFSRFGPARLELRVATIPTNNGIENVILRLLAAAKPLPLESLGIDPHVLERLRALAERPHGLLLVVGPTGSGKTTTLHSLIAHINTPERKIWTAEDPVEITQEGLCQVQVNPKIDWTFAAALRSFLRADPDVIMVGEMRDAETAATGVEASLTGHLVMSTLHTNSAPETVTRLLDLGVDPFNFGDSLLGVLAQRLARRVCGSCGETHPADPATLESLAREFVAGSDVAPREVLERWNGWATPPVLARGAGCGDCGGTGYRGRLGLYEFMDVDAALRALIQGKANTDRLRDVARAAGMRTLRQDGIEKVLRGFTTMDQVRAACP